METGFEVSRSNGWRSKLVAAGCLGLIGLCVVAMQSPFARPTRVAGTPKLRYSAVDDTSEIYAWHGHDQDMYRDFIWQEYRDAVLRRKKLHECFPQCQPAKNVTANKLPLTFSLCGNCSGVEGNWQRLLGISQMCLDYNKDVRDDHHCKYDPTRQGNTSMGCDIETSEQHFATVKRRYIDSEAGPYLKGLEFVQELRRYIGTSKEQNAGFVAYHPRAARFEREVLIVLEGSMTCGYGADCTHNFHAVGTNFIDSVLTPLNVTPKHGPVALREHIGYSEIVVEMFPQIKAAIKTIEGQKGQVSRVVITGHSLGSSVGAGVLKVFDEEGIHRVLGVLFAQPNSFKLKFFSDFFTNFWKTVLTAEATMAKKVLNVHNLWDIPVLASEVSYYVPLGSEIQFTPGDIRPKK